MKKIIFCSLLSIFSGSVFAQLPKIYVNLATHNELIGEYYDTNKNAYDSAVTVIDQILNHMVAIDGRWNFQSCSKFVLGALNWDNAATSPNDVLERMFTSGKVQLDSRNKTDFPNYLYNISDVYHLYDSCGVTSTHTVGGFLAYPYSSEDWTPFRTPKIGAVYGLPWQADIIWGGGSPGHVQDLNDYGVWKPKDGDSQTNVYTHDPNANLWLVGNGCAPVIYDTTNDVQWIVNLMRDNLQRIQSGVWPSNKFYSLSVMINVRDFDSPGFYLKVQTVLDSIQAFVNKGQMEWAFITDKLAAFQTWSAISGVAYSQLSCADATAGAEELNTSNFNLYPNPVTNELFITTGLDKNVSYQIVNTQGKIVNFGELNPSNNNRILVDKLTAGIYFVKIEDSTFKIMKE